MHYLIIGIASLVLAILPISLNPLGRILAIFSGFSSLIYALMALRIYDFKGIGDLSLFVWLEPEILTPQSLEALIVFLLALLASFSYRQATLAALDVKLILRLPPWLSPLTISLATIGSLYTIYVIGPSTLLSYQGYGTIMSPQSFPGVGPLGALIIGLTRPAVLLTLVCTVWNFLSRSNKLMGYFGLFPIFLALLIGLSQASRIVPLYLGTIAATLFISRRRKMSFIFVALVIAANIFSISARNNSNLGLEFVPKYAIESLTSSDGIENFAVNMFGGLLVSDASLHASTPSSYSESYKILSFMPTIGAMDGFQEVLAANQQRVSHAIPFNAASEAYAFGIFYYVLLWSILLFTIFCINSSAVHSKMMYAILLCIFIVGWAHMSQYPIRNSVRYFYVIILLRFTIYFVQKNRNRKARPALIEPRPMLNTPPQRSSGC